MANAFDIPRDPDLSRFLQKQSYNAAKSRKATASLDRRKEVDPKANFINLDRRKK